MNTDRDPIDPSTLGRAVSTWLTSEDGDEDADQALIDVMLAQGVLTPEEADEALIQDGCEYPQATIEIHDGAILVIINEYGTVRTTRA